MPLSSKGSGPCLLIIDPQVSFHVSRNCTHDILITIPYSVRMTFTEVVHWRLKELTKMLFVSRIL